MPALSSYVGRLERDVEQASHQPYRDDQPAYDEGMQTLWRELAEIVQAIRANDMTRKHYPDLLG